jgi:SAM-dependent methyltransferase
MNPKDIVRTGYDKISHTYRGDHLDWSDPAIIQYTQWVTDLIALIPSRGTILDLGCGNGIPVAKVLVDAGFALIGVDISAVQIARAQIAVPSARFVCADMTGLTFQPQTFTAIVCFYAIIHVPLAEQPALLASIYEWLQPGGYLLATVGAETWTGTEENWLDVAGGQMYWSHADKAAYEQWCMSQGFRVCWTRFIPEGNSGHTLLLAQKPAE